MKPEKILTDRQIDRQTDRQTVGQFCLFAVQINL